MVEKIRCLIVDDDAISRKMLEVMIQRVKNLDLVESCSNALLARQILASQRRRREMTDYLLKPVVLDRFLKAIDRVEKRIALEQDSYTTSESVFVKANNQIVGIRLTDITWIEAYGDYVNIFTEKDRFIVHATMKGIESKMPRDQFIRVHRSYIIRFDRIQAIEDTVVIIGKKLIPIGESYKAELMRRLNLL
jgi:DNA-binding LytR/AlgR family response regulator